MSGRMTQKSWTTEQNMILHGLAANPEQYANRKAVLDAILENIPTISASKALYHAITHEKIKFNIAAKALHGDALAMATDMLTNGFDSAATQKQVKLQFGTYLPTRYYNRVRFTSRRGEYNIVKDPDNPGRFTMQQRVEIRGEIKTMDKVTSQTAQQQMARKVVTRPVTKDVSLAGASHLYLTTRANLYKIKQINFAAESLGLDFGAIMSQVKEDDLSRYTPQKILQDIFASNGLDVNAMSVFAHPTAPENEA